MGMSLSRVSEDRAMLSRLSTGAPLDIEKPPERVSPIWFDCAICTVQVCLVNLYAQAVQVLTHLLGTVLSFLDLPLSLYTLGSLLQNSA